MGFEATSVKPVAVEYPILYLEIGVSGQRAAFAAINISDPATPVVLGRSELSGSIQEVQVVDSHAMILVGGRLNLYEISPGRGSDGAYRAWQERYFSEEADLSLVGPAADPDRGGASNWMEFALGQMPLHRESPPLGLSFSDNKKLVSYGRQASVARWFDYVIETSPSMAPGSWEPVPEARKVS